MMGYIANTRTMIFHELNCQYKPTDNSKIILNTEGYKPCGKCCPQKEK